MPSIPERVKQIIAKEQVLIIGTSFKEITNVSPRTAFHVDPDGSIYWLEIFKHKTFRNLHKNEWCSISIFDKKELTGYQLKGKARLLTDRKKKHRMSKIIIDRLTRLHKQKILKQSKNQRINIVKFSAKLVYSLNPNEISDTPIVIDDDSHSLRVANLHRS